MNPSRRAVLAASAAAVGGAPAGCLDVLSGSGASSGAPVQTSFYLLYDFASRVAGDAQSVDSVVPFGQHGHGWDGPTAGQQREIHGADLFVYVGEGFQPWADDVVANLRDDGEDVEIVAAREGVELLPIDDHDDGHDEDDGHDHGDHDPHFWLDPSRTVRAVENVRDGLVAVDPDGESGYRERADEYVAQVRDLDRRFEEALSDRVRDAVLVAGHDAFRYLGQAYGFEVRGLSGLSPDEGVSAAARREAEEFVDEHDLRHVLHPVLEPRGPAEQIVADTDAEAVLDVAAISGVTDEWRDDGWGYLEVMDSVNLPSFETALTEP